MKNFVRAVLCMASLLLTSVLASATIHLSDKVSERGERFIVTVTKVADLQNEQGRIAAEKATSIMFEFDLSSLGSSDSSGSLEPLTANKISTYAATVSHDDHVDHVDHGSDSSSPKMVSISQQLATPADKFSDPDMFSLVIITADVTLNVSSVRTDTGSRLIVVSALVQSWKGNTVLQQEEFDVLVELSVSNGRISLLPQNNSHENNIILDPVPETTSSSSSSLSDCPSENKYWCELTELARGAKQTAKAVADHWVLAGEAFMDSASDAINAAVLFYEPQSTTATDTAASPHKKKSKSKSKTKSCKNGGLSHKWHEWKKGGKAQKPGSNGHRHHRYHGGGSRNESATSIANGVAHTVFTVAIPLLIGLVSGTVVVLIAVSIADTCISYIHRHYVSTIVISEDEFQDLAAMRRESIEKRGPPPSYGNPYLESQSSMDMHSKA
ncbi:hypothetical protein V1514DRAFT_213882 [Lipomyces japonicus]|uniref:uncharacterized protein n=1 Tax=Lipomyces japonicus TaxID=56871 RepID=UPI0034CF49D2